MDLASVLGYSSGFLFIMLSILMALRFNFSAMSAYVDWPSVMCTIGGSIAGTLIAYPLPKIITAMKSFKTVIFPTTTLDTKVIIEQLIDLANVARKEGILALEEAAQTMEEKFLKKGLLLIVDGTEPELVRGILETDISYMQTRHKDVASTWSYIASMGPAWGMIGTLIGLVNMLNNMSDAASLGPNMAVALLTTFYGSVLANYIAIPTAQKMSVYDAEETALKELILEGLLSIQAGENPRIIEEKLKAFLAPSLRDSIGAGFGFAGGDE